jgi:MFS family permease
MSDTVDAGAPGGPRGAARRAGDVLVGKPQRGVFAILGLFLPDTSVARKIKFQHLLTAKFLADAGRDSVKYAAIVGVIYNGGGAFASSLIGLASLIPGVVFSLYGGAVSDSLPKRTALTIAYGTDVALLILVPLLFPDSNLVYFMLVFAVTTLTQIASPAEQTLVPLVTSDEQLATANSIMGMVSSIGTAFGTAILAPILLKAFGTEAVFYISAGLLLAAMSRVIYVDTPGDLQRRKFIKPKGTFMKAVRWLARNRAIGTMVAVSAIAGMGYTIMSTLAPTYVNDVLDQDPANTVYIMGIAGVGMTISLFLVPTLIGRFGERWVAGIGFLILCVSLVGLGLVNSGVLEFLTPINPFHWINELFDRMNINEKTEIAMLIAFPLGVGAGMTDNSVKTYLNRRVPVVYQGRTFATRNLSESALTIPPLLGVSALAVWFGISSVLFIMPVVFYFVVLALLRVSAALSDEETPEEGGVFKTYWEASEDEAISAMDEDDLPPQAAPAAT